MHARTLGICVLVSLLSSTCFAQSSVTPRNQEIVTDRPDITESSVTVPARTLQRENGVDMD